MKVSRQIIVVFALLAFTFCEVIFLQDSPKETPIYSGVISAKRYVVGSEKKIFFVALPMSYNMMGSIGEGNSNITLRMPNAQKDKGNLKFLREANDQIIKSKFASLLKVDLTKDKEQLKVDFTNFHDSFIIEKTRWYNNKDFYNLEAKIVHKESAHILYITLDFFKQSVTDKSAFENAFNAYKK